jgi:hypothetical protein
MDEFYLLVSARRLNGDPDTMSRIAKCVFDHDAAYGGVQTGRWYRLEIFDNPFPHDLDLVFVGLSSDPGIRASGALAERFEASLNRASKHRWRVDNCGPIDAEDAALLRIELEALNFFGD